MTHYRPFFYIASPRCYPRLSARLSVQQPDEQTVDLYDGEAYVPVSELVCIRTTKALPHNYLLGYPVSESRASARLGHSRSCTRLGSGYVPTTLT